MCVFVFFDIIGGGSSVYVHVCFECANTLKGVSTLYLSSQTLVGPMKEYYKEAQR